MRIWVSGASGQLGGEVARQLREAGHDVVEADLRGDPPVDLEDPDAVARSLAGCDAIVHCAAIPNPLDTEPATLVRLNTMSTFNALEQAWLAGIRVAVLASSGSIWGTAWGPEDMRQPYVPVDEDSLLQYVDPYALSKDFLERMGQMYARRGMTVTALRFHWILTPQLVRDIDIPGFPPERELGNLWGWVGLADAARACVLALTPIPDRQPYEVCVVAAGDTSRHEPTADLLAQCSPESELRRPIKGTDSCFSSDHARRVLGWSPQESWRDRTDEHEAR